MAQVNFNTNEDDRQCALLGALGFTSNFIRKSTGLTFGQIGYRLKRAGVVRADYRNGLSKPATMVIRAVHETMNRRLDQFYPTMRRLPPSNHK